MKALLIPILSFLLFPSFAQSPDSGSWQGILRYEQEGVPFSFDVSETTGKIKVVLTNGKERIDITDLDISGDSIFMKMPIFDAQLRAKFTSKTMLGKWMKGYKETTINFTAEAGKPRFLLPDAKSKKIQTKWSMTFKPGSSGEYAAIASFEQNGNSLTGTVVTGTGDFRYMEGAVFGDSIVLSSFDGAHGFMMTGKRTNGVWNGEFHFDNNYAEKWVATPNKGAAMPDPFEVVDLTSSSNEPYFDLLGAGSGADAIDLDKYIGKVLIIQLFGTWCPNSLDQSRYLIDRYAEKHSDVEVLAVSYELNYSKEYGLKRIDEYKKELQIPYDIVLGGRMNKRTAAMPFPFMDRIEAFPTLVILDKSGQVRKVHSYFQGPATGILYQEFDKKLSVLIEELIAEE